MFTVGYTLLVHAVFHLFQIKFGNHGGVDDRNVSLLEMASSPSNVFSEALEGDAMAVGVISTLLVLVAAYRYFILRRVQSAWRAFNVHVNQHVVVMTLLGFIWWCVVRTSSCPSWSAHKEESICAAQWRQGSDNGHGSDERGIGGA